ncbi:MAG: monovalent cation/H+ antiporter subunit D family protein [Schwartzia sp.]|nr:monovalent cation/H+ antiporter subunit D family protein [Schwartzia sp. (in: firmicutes)]
MSLALHSPVFIVLLPLSASLLCLAFSRIHRKLGAYVVQLALFGALISSLVTMRHVLAEGTKSVHYWMGNWAPPIGIEFVVDPLNTAVACMITFLAFVISFYSKPFLENEDWLHYGGYFTLYGLLTVGLCGMTVTGDVFNMYVYLEIMSLSGYGLIALGGHKSMLAAFRYLLVGTIGASLYLIGIGYLYAMTGSLNMADISERIQPFVNTPLFAFVVACFLIAFGIKMALFPLHGWQPDSYTYSHPGAAGFISGCMSKVPAYAMLRYFFYVFGIHNTVMGALMNVLGIMGICGILIGSVMALAQYDFRRMLAYSSVAQLGYIAVGMAMGNIYGFIGAVLHLINHAFMKSSLFLVVGGIAYRFGEVNLYRLGGLNKKMPVSSIATVLAVLSMIGIPPTCGFFSKWYLMLGAFEGQQYIFIAVLVVSSLLNAIYYVRIVEQMFVQREASLTEIHDPETKLGMPLSMVIPIGVTGLAILILGIYSSSLVTNIVEVGLPEVLLK